MDNDTCNLAFPSVEASSVPRRNEFWKYSTRTKGTRFNGVNASLPGALFNDNEPQWANQKERPVHRRIVTLAEQGYTGTEIAAATGHTAQTVRNALRQPHARKHMIETMQQDVSLEIKRFLEAEVLPSLEVAKSIRDNELLKASDRLSAVNVFLDRHLGRPNQPFSLPTNGKPPSEMTADELRTALAATGFDAAHAAAVPAAGTATTS